ncbi:TerC family protein [Bradyrhizobium sp. CCGUVB23]|uniref:TerC family protein n=1 Tax=Bradyrhizobium sp. CCGUVB23 TaxID=2949630 RepID=UPI0020B2F446|nr:TerC family protein [Bradyrhizobium sp. CCGUVB23]MCP3467206.1 TerC family protein [Bradyrhizobium sp. CCGUVB23]
MSELLNIDALTALLQVVVIDLVLAGDNAIVIGLAAAGLSDTQRGKAILIGVLAATVLRILFAVLTTQIMQIVGLLLAGGILLLWVCWKMWRELRTSSSDEDANTTEVDTKREPGKTLFQAISQIVVADVSMSLDNVLAVAGAAREQPVILIFGLTLSIAMMGAAASLIARLLQHQRWIAYVGLLVIVYVAVDMIFRGVADIVEVAASLTPVATGGVARNSLRPRCFRTILRRT